MDKKNGTNVVKYRYKRRFLKPRSTALHGGSTRGGARANKTIDRFCLLTTIRPTKKMDRTCLFGWVVG